MGYKIIVLKYDGTVLLNEDDLRSAVDSFDSTDAQIQIAPWGDIWLVGEKTDELGVNQGGAALLYDLSSNKIVSIPEISWNISGGQWYLDNNIFPPLQTFEGVRQDDELLFRHNQIQIFTKDGELVNTYEYSHYRTFMFIGLDGALYYREGGESGNRLYKDTIPK